MPYLPSEAAKKSKVYSNILNGPEIEYQKEIDFLKQQQAPEQAPTRKLCLLQHQTSNYGILAGDCVCPAPFPKAFSDIARGPNWSAPGAQVQPVTSAISVVFSSIFWDRVLVPWAV